MIGVTFGEIEVGMEHTFVAKADMQLVRQFAMVSGDRNPTHLDEDFALSVGLDAPVIHKMIIPMILSEYFGNTFPGPGTGWRKQELEFLSPVFVGEQLIILLEVLEKEAPQKVVIGVTVKSYKGHVVAKGIETLDAPLEHYPVKPSNLPFFYLPDRHVQLAQLISRATRSRPPSMAVAWPHNNESLQGAVDAMNKGLVVPVFFGIREKIVDIASDLGVDITNIKIVDASDEVTACDMAARAVGRDEIDILAKGSPHSDTFLRAILSRESNMRIQGGHLSHVFYVDGIPPRHGETKPRSIVITDGALNIQPTLQEKAKITQNAIDFLHSMGVEKPRVAVLAAVEVVNHGMSVTLDAAALTVMAQRGQITGAYVDGPMAMDLATNPEAAKAKGFVSEVAGRADILLCPTIEAGNIAAKEYEQMNVLMAGVLCGTKKPVVLTSRSDDSVNRLAAIAIACILL